MHAIFFLLLPASLHHRNCVFFVCLLNGNGLGALNDVYDVMHNERMIFVIITSMKVASLPWAHARTDQGNPASGIKCFGVMINSYYILTVFQSPAKAVYNARHWNQPEPEEVPVPPISRSQTAPVRYHSVVIIIFSTTKAKISVNMKKTT